MTYQHMARVCAGLMALALARLQSTGGGASGEPLDRFAAALPAESSLAPLRWEAQAYAAQADCQGGAVEAGERRLRVLETELHRARPEGGRLSPPAPLA